MKRTNRSIWIILCLFQGTVLFAQPGASKSSKISSRYQVQPIASESFESAGVFDVNGDGTPDIVSGSFWYEGPGFKNRFFIGNQKRFGEYYDDFATIPLDINGDGRMDFITGGWFGKQLRWMENPGNDKEWAEHIFASPGNVECIMTGDLDQDGVPEIIPNTPNAPLVVYRLVRDASGKGTGEFTAIKIADTQGHGIGCGDINGDGYADIIISSGWLQSPGKDPGAAWKLHTDFSLGDASVPILVVDVNKDGRNDLISGMGHNYGLSWYEQQPAGNATRFVKHDIDMKNSQFHALAYADLDGDGNKELVTGKRYRAHNGKDPGSSDDYGIYAYTWNGRAFDKRVIAFGPYGTGKGTGIYFSIADMNKDGVPDIVTAGKDGLWIFRSKGKITK